ncbi:Zinc finger, RING/FYVE/PHD-type [Cynara cardunculus var. scolymus]|uniref:RING-type E3 ubiquitin transferase n=1 Tax=Cynara cardunculus var. scolymus TaxID=59895 RepID=A0A103XT16_CYNCS|nr:Zinc finger, RING/FYVE/PHD-type [Cynara cardunculus var. scolymus]
MGSLCSCFRAAVPDDESIDSDDDEQIQDSSGMVNRTAQAHFTSFLQNLTNKGSKKCHAEIPLMVALDKVKSKVNTISEDEEDVCPICLEEYTSENPRIVTKCSHHYHLSCIYEWNERSETCPVCSKAGTIEDRPELAILR